MTFIQARHRAPTFPRDVWPVIVDYLTAEEACKLSMASRSHHHVTRRTPASTTWGSLPDTAALDELHVWRRLASCWHSAASLKRAMFCGLREVTLDGDTEFIVHGHVALWAGNTEIVRRISVEPGHFGEVESYPDLEYDDVVPLGKQLIVATEGRLQMIGPGSKVTATVPFSFDYDEGEVTRLFLDMASAVLYVLHGPWLAGYRVDAPSLLRESYTIKLPLRDIDGLMFRASIGHWAILHDSQRRILVYDSRTGKTILDETLPLEDECIVYADAWPPWLVVLTPRELYRINIEDDDAGDRNMWEAFPISGTGIAGVEFRRCALEVKIDPKDPEQFLLLSSPYFDGETALVLCRRTARSTLSYVAAYTLEPGYFCDRLEYRHDGSVVEVCVGKQGVDAKIAGVYSRVVWLDRADLSVIHVFDNAVGEWRTDVRDCAASVVCGDDDDGVAIKLGPLTSEIWRLVVGYLSAPEACNLAMTSKALWRLIDTHCGCEIAAPDEYRIWKRLASCWRGPESLEKILATPPQTLTLPRSTDFITYGHGAVWSGDKTTITRWPMGRSLAADQPRCTRFLRVPRGVVAPGDDALLAAANGRLVVMGPGGEVKMENELAFSDRRVEGWNYDLLLDKASSMVYALHGKAVAGYHFNRSRKVDFLYKYELPLTDPDCLIVKIDAGHCVIFHDMQQRVLVHDAKSGGVIQDARIPSGGIEAVDCKARPHSESLVPMWGKGEAWDVSRRYFGGVAIDPKDSDRFLLLSYAIFGGRTSVILSEANGCVYVGILIASYDLEEGYTTNGIGYRHDGSIIELLGGVAQSRGSLNDSCLRELCRILAHPIRDCVAVVDRADGGAGVIVKYWDLTDSSSD
ncbi:hypothetical protein FOZ60_008266 [Perkinsus olseni]|uniref:F-box domain-containing protein n=1 Tax=Perkinsus olseni TaxID=32597 RepID=A0A7J6PF75_PEROL|nr:hypothetical protein FOZ60_008266 [Perkinsus olseni]